MGQREMIIVEIVVHASLKEVWEFWTGAEHITHWAFASNDWEVPEADNEVRVGGRFRIVMAAKDKNEGFDFTGFYTSVKEGELIEYELDDGRRVRVEFAEVDGGVRVSESFEPEKENSEEIQRSGW